MSQVKDLLQNRQLFGVEEHQTVAEVARRMAELRVGAIPVLAGGELRGVFSERDLMTRVVVEKLDPERTAVRAVMSTNLETVDENATLETAMEKMLAHSCRHLPVMREGTVVGFLSMRDLMNHELAVKTEEVDHMRAYIQSGQ
jgi:CBS domain-containing protein